MLLPIHPPIMPPNRRTNPHAPRPLWPPLPHPLLLNRLLLDLIPRDVERLIRARLAQRLLDQHLRLGLQVGHLLGFLVLVEVALEQRFERLRPHGLGEVVVHSGVEAFFAVALDGGRGHGDDQDVADFGVGVGADEACCCWGFC